MDLIRIVRGGRGAVELRVRGQVLTSDLAREEGGEGRGIKPVELLAGSLGACIVLIVQAYCDNHGYKDGEVAASLALELADKPKRVGSIVIDLELPGDCPAEKKRAIKRIAAQCAVHATLKQMPKVDLEIV